MFSLGRILVGIAIFIIGGFSGSMLATVVTRDSTDMYLEPNEGSFILNTPITVSVKVRSDIPVNVFAGDIFFDESLLRVVKIDYNTSLADIWAVEPWYENGGGTVTFAGGTTRTGGFLGDDTLLTITFESTNVGDASINLMNAHILEHDGLGTAVELEDNPIDAIFTLQTEQIISETVFWKDQSNSVLSISENSKTTDLNGDGKTSLFDLSIFMLDITTQNMRSDFNNDNKVNTVDLNIILGAE